MKCLYCGHLESKVVDSRPADEGERIRRRRECLSCGKRFTTYEIIENLPFMVIKKDHSREPFDRTKLFNGLMRACQKRPFSAEDLDNIVTEIENRIQNSLEREITSTQIGEMALAKLRDLDDVAYVRFASVYRDFDNIQAFMDELKMLEKTRKQP